MIAYHAVVGCLLFVSSLPTTRDPIGAMDASEVLRAEVFSIFINMFTLLILPPFILMLWLVWGQLLTRGRLLRDFERMIDQKEVKQ